MKIRVMLRQVVEDRGYDVEDAPDCVEGVRLFNRSLDRRAYR